MYVLITVINPYRFAMAMKVYCMHASMYGWCHKNIDESIATSGKHGLSDIVIFSSMIGIKLHWHLITRAVVSLSYYNIIIGLPLLQALNYIKIDHKNLTYSATAGDELW